MAHARAQDAYSARVQRSVIAAWTAAWPAGAAIGVANGALRELTYGRRLGESAAHQVSGVTAIAGFAGLFWALERRRPIPSTAGALTIGAVWLGLTVAFEFGFGRAVAKQSWDELLADYDVVHGRTWPFVLAWVASGPAVVRTLHQRSAPGAR
jgi:hypothetical protein